MDSRSEWWGRNRKKVAIIGGVVAVLVVVAVIVLAVRNAMFSAKVAVTVAPSVAKVEIDGATYDAVGEYGFVPGEYVVRVSAEGFLPREEKLIAVANETVDLALYLVPTESNGDWYENHPEDALIVGSIENGAAVVELRELMEMWPLVKKLPTKHATFGIGYEICEAYEAVCISVEAGFGFKDAAVGFLRERETNLAHYVVDGDVAFVGAVEPAVIGDGATIYGGEIVPEELPEVMAAARTVAEASLVDRELMVEVAQVKRVGDFYAVIVWAMDMSGVHDSYRMVVGRVDGAWQALTMPELVLSQYEYPGLPVALLNAVNNW